MTTKAEERDGKEMEGSVKKNFIIVAVIFVLLLLAMVFIDDSKAAEIPAADTSGTVQAVLLQGPNAV